jgi:hypothetical protein
MVGRVTERRLVDVLVSHLRRDGVVEREVKHYERRIDVATVPFGSSEVWAIEAKTADWSRAMSQAIVNLAASQRSYIAIYSKHVHRVRMDVLDRHGIGLISVGTKWGDVVVLKAAPRSSYTNPIATARIRQAVQGDGVE